MLYFSSSAFLISLLFITAVCVLFPIKLRKFNQKVTLQRFLFFFFFSYLIPGQFATARREEPREKNKRPSWKLYQPQARFISFQVFRERTSALVCSRRSDRGDGAKRCEQKKTRGWGRGERNSLFSSLFFSRSLPSRSTPLSERLEQATSGLEPGYKVHGPVVSSYGSVNSKCTHRPPGICWAFVILSVQVVGICQKTTSRGWGNGHFFQRRLTSFHFQYFTKIYKFRKL